MLQFGRPYNFGIEAGSKPELMAVANVDGALVGGASLKAAVDVLSGRDPVFLGRRETGVDAAVSDS